MSLDLLGISTPLRDFDAFMSTIVAPLVLFTGTLYLDVELNKQVIVSKSNI